MEAPFESAGAFAIAWKTISFDLREALSRQGLDFSSFPSDLVCLSVWLTLCKCSTHYWFLDLLLRHVPGSIELQNLVEDLPVLPVPGEPTWAAIAEILGLTAPGTSLSEKKRKKERQKYRDRLVSAMKAASEIPLDFFIAIKATRSKQPETEFRSLLLQRSADQVVEVVKKLPYSRGSAAPSLQEVAASLGIKVPPPSAIRIGRIFGIPNVGNLGNPHTAI